jgi:hypothetical protein
MSNSKERNGEGINEANLEGNGRDECYGLYDSSGAQSDLAHYATLAVWSFHRNQPSVELSERWTLIRIEIRQSKEVGVK